jgi:diketogulonate reductase-like aldo/keto reductase
MWKTSGQNSTSSNLNSKIDINKRKLLKMAAASFCALQFPYAFSAPSRLPITKKIPSSGEVIPVIGMGTWQTFNVGNNQSLRDKRCEVLTSFFNNGGGMIDSSPMYGSSEAVLGSCLQRLGFPKENFSATKVWTSSVDEGIEQINDSYRLWQIDKFDLFQVHNLLGWEDHLPYLQKMKSEGKLNYVGITTSHGRRHTDLEKIIKSQKIDFVQLTYNIADREVESRLLPLAKDMGVAVIANRPFRGGSLFSAVKNEPLPAFAKDINCDNWSQFFLKFIISHHAITCVIPATSKVEHMEQNMAARFGPLPDDKMRQKMIATLQSL